MRARLLAAFSATAAIIAAACSGGGGGASGSPTPTGSPTASQPPDSCRVVWISPDNVTNLNWNMFLVDAPIADWMSGTLNYSVNSPLGVFYYGYDPNAKTSLAAAVTTAGSFDVTLGNGTTTNAAITWDDATTQTFFALNLATGAVSGEVGTGGTGHFDGVWSDPAGSPTGGNGNLAIAWMGSSFNLGGLGKYAQCYHTTAPFQRLDRADRLREALSTLPQTW